MFNVSKPIHSATCIQTNKNGETVSLYYTAVHGHTAVIINASVVTVVSIICVACMSMDKR